MAFKYAADRERRDYLLLPLPPKDFEDGSKAFPFFHVDPEGPQFLPGTLPLPRPIQMGNACYGSAIEDLAASLHKLVGSFWSEGSNGTLFLTGYRGTADAIGSGYHIGLRLYEEDPNPGSAVLGELYEQLSRITGPTATREVRSQLLQKLSGMAEISASWLVQRLRNEQDIDAQESALCALAQIGQPAFKYVVAELTQLVGTDDADHATLFLRALRRFRSTELGPLVHIVFALIASFSSSIYPEVREAAFRATVVLPRQQALKILISASSTEPDQEIHQAVEELIEQTTRERG